MMNILICTDGSPSAEKAAALVGQLPPFAESKIALLGVCEAESDHASLAASMERILTALGGARPGMRQCIRYGQPVEQILAETQEHAYQMVVIGWRDDRRLPVLKLGSTAEKLARRLQTHLLVVRNLPQKLQRILFCTGAEPLAVKTVQRGGQLIAGLQAEVTLLHVISPSELRSTPTPEALYYSAEEAIQRGSSVGKHLQKAIQQLQQAGVSGTIRPILRHGLVVDEILVELQRGDYDLLVAGAHHQPGQNRWLGVLLDDITDQLLNQSPCSVLIV